MASKKRRPSESRLDFLARIHTGSWRELRRLSGVGGGAIDSIRMERPLTLDTAQKIAAPLGCQWAELVQP